MLWGPYSMLKEGTYRAVFPLAVSGVTTGRTRGDDRGLRVAAREDLRE